MREAISARYRLAHKLSSVKQTVAQAVGDDFLVTHPDWIARYGERARQFCMADTCFHLEFLSGPSKPLPHEPLLIIANGPLGCSGRAV